MRRRQLLAALAAAASTAGVGAVERGRREGLRPAGAGPAGRASPADATVRDGEPSDATAGDGATLGDHGYPPTICDAPVRPDFHIRAIDDPAVAADWSGVRVADRYGDLTDRTTVVGLERDGRARAYPLPVLYAHEVVNDRLGGPVLVTYCPLCQSALVAERVVDDAPAVFGVSGQLWQPPRIRARASEAANRTFAAVPNGTGAYDGQPDSVRATANLVLYDDATGSYWSQLLGRAICGPLAGTRLSVLPTTLTTWGEWRAAHPGTEVLLAPPASGTM